MKNYLFILLYLLSAPLLGQELGYDRVFFENSRMPESWFYSKAVYQSPSYVKNIQEKLPISTNEFFTPGNSLELNYTSSPGGSWTAEILYPETRGQDVFKEADFLSFFVFADTSVPLDQLPQIAVGSGDKVSSYLSLGNFIPDFTINQWVRVKIPLKAFAGDDFKTFQKINRVIFGQNVGDNKEHRILIDQLELVGPEIQVYNVNRVPEITTAKGYAMHVDIAWQEIMDKNVRLVKIYRSENGKDYHAVGIQQNDINRYADYTGETSKKYNYKISFLNQKYEESNLSAPVTVSTKPMTDDELLTMVQEASFRYYWEGAEANSGLAKENIPGRNTMIAAGASGFGIMSLVVGVERGFVTRAEAVARMVKIVNFLVKAETFHGAYPHFIDGPSGKVEPFFGHQDNGADLVETSFLFQGLLAARQYFTGANAQEQMIREKITAIWEKVEWDWFRKSPDSKFLYWHWSPDQEWVINHTLIGWNETMVTYLLAIASPTHSVPASMYYSGWANQDSTGQYYRGWGQTKDGTMYTNGNTYFGIKLDVGVSRGGPLFFIHYSFMGYDPHDLNDKYTNYFINNQNIAKINHRYCTQNPKRFKGYSDSAWGLTASIGPYDYTADEPVLWQDYGKLTPTGAIGSFPYTPEESMKALKNYYFNYGKFLWGEYGFKDAFDLTQNWCSGIYMGLNQAPQVVMIENYRTGLIWKLFMKNDEVKMGLKKLRLISEK